MCHLTRCVNCPKLNSLRAATANASPSLRFVRYNYDMSARVDNTVDFTAEWCIGRQSALECGSHDTPVAGHAALHLNGTEQADVNEQLLGELYLLAKAEGNPFQFGGDVYDQHVYAIEVEEGSRRALARRAGLDRGQQLAFKKVVGLIFRSDNTGHMQVEQYKDVTEFRNQLEQERRLDLEAAERAARELHETVYYDLPRLG